MTDVIAQEKTIEVTKTSKYVDENETKEVVATDEPDNKSNNSEDIYRHRKERRERSPIVLKRGVRGSVNWFSANCGYGFIHREDIDADIFVHASSIVRCTRQPLVLLENQQVEFDVVKGSRGIEANCVSGPNGRRVGFFMGNRMLAQQRFNNNNPNRFRRRNDGIGSQRKEETQINGKEEQKEEVVGVIIGKEEAAQEHGKHSVSPPNDQKQKSNNRRIRNGGVPPNRRRRRNPAKESVEKDKEDDGTKSEKKEADEGEKKSDGSESSEKNDIDTEKEDGEKGGEEEKNYEEEGKEEEEKEKKDMEENPDETAQKGE